jgi:hypothetical protein
MTGRGSTGWSCAVLSPAGDVQLEQVDDDGQEWLGEGPGGEAWGALGPVREACAAAGSGSDWIQAVVDAVGRELAAGAHRSMLLVKQGEGVWFHASFTSNRESIREHGLDWRRMTGQGIAGSTAPEWPGVFLCANLEDVGFFVRMGERRGSVDVWAVELDGQWLEGAPDSDGGGGDNWMICPEPITPNRLGLVDQEPHPDLSQSR